LEGEKIGGKLGEKLGEIPLSNQLFCNLPRVAEKLVGKRKNWEKIGRKLGENWEKFHFPPIFLQLTCCGCL